MGTEILTTFIVIPIALWCFDVFKVISNQSTKTHLMLLVVGLSSLGYMSLSSYLGGWHPMQGFIIGSVFYGPVYLALYMLLKFTIKDKPPNKAGHSEP